MYAQMLQRKWKQLQKFKKILDEEYVTEEENVHDSEQNVKYISTIHYKELNNFRNI